MEGTPGFLPSLLCRVREFRPEAKAPETAEPAWRQTSLNVRETPPLMPPDRVADVVNRKKQFLSLYLKKHRVLPAVILPETAVRRVVKAARIPV